MNGQYIFIQRLTIPKMEESNIDWLHYIPDTLITFIEHKLLKSHQIQALEKVHIVFQTGGYSQKEEGATGIEYSFEEELRLKENECSVT